MLITRKVKGALLDALRAEGFEFQPLLHLVGGAKRCPVC